MRLFTCSSCGNLLYFENVACLQCNSELGFVPEERLLDVITPFDKNGSGYILAANEKSYRKCRNYYKHAVCNWMIDAAENEEFCIACQLNRTIPNLSIEKNKDLWNKLEIEKRRLVFSLLQLGLDVRSKNKHPNGLAFDFLADHGENFSERDRVMTGHDDGLITINIAEADPVQREKMRTSMEEHYRTILGHFRHESGHYYWDQLIKNTDDLREYRDIFGDESQDYSAALDRHYKEGPPDDWKEHFVSVYASSHPWEDWAESWAHYLHIMDTLETAYSFGIHIEPRTLNGDDLAVKISFSPYMERDFNTIFEHWLSVSFALNSLNRSMGHAHAYPFVISPSVVTKLDFIHKIILKNTERI
ncbi:MAG: putative zinc-binding peptidase [Methanolobus sp.]|nr:putative zinc-binding peptidase [Methanolobus sp.]